MQLKAVNSINIEQNIVLDYILLNGKVKVIPLQAWTGPEGSRSLRLPDFKTIST